jgi:hypothetical protein
MVENRSIVSVLQEAVMRKAAMAVGLVALLVPVAGNVRATHVGSQPAAVSDGTPIPPLPPPGKHPGLTADGMPLPPLPPKKPAKVMQGELA